MSSVRARLPPGPPSIRLTHLENELCTHVENFTQRLRLENQNVICYIAGGWVRDKLLGKESNDIDIALSSMMGFPFATKFAEFLAEHGVPVTRVTKVESRAEQSKHLETAKVVVLGLELDFVNLRSEEYTEQSRIPTAVKFGTPEEDTLRRDITINALLYNIHSRTVEDHTHKGLDDLHNGIIRTPLPPKQTFLDDPLRVLRCVRFASRFGYELVPELANAVRDREIQSALETKISRERIGDEVDKMIKGPDPLRAVQLIDSLDLYHTIFIPPQPVSLRSSVPHDIQRHAALAAVSILQHLISLAGESSDAVPTIIDSSLPRLHPSLLSHFMSEPSARWRLLLASALTPFKGLTYQEKKKTKPLVEACIRESLKLGLQNHYLDGIPALFAASDLLYQPRPDKFETRAAIGLLLRDKAVHNPITGTHWTSSLLFSLVQELVPMWDGTQNQLNASAKEIVSLYITFVDKVEELGLTGALEDPPILDGREISSLLSRDPGPWLGRMLNKIIEWQLGHPGFTKDECAAWLKDEVNAGRITLDDKPNARSKDDPDTQRQKKAKVG